MKTMNQRIYGLGFLLILGISVLLVVVVVSLAAQPGPPKLPYVILTADPSGIVADGSATATVNASVWLWNEDDEAYSEQIWVSTLVPVEFSTDLGEITASAPIINGTATAILTAGTEPGVATITAEMEVEAIGLGTNTTEVTFVSPQRELTRITLQPSTAPPLVIGENQQFTATAYDQYDAEMVDVLFTWSSSNETVGTVDATGLFTALAEGTTTVMAYNVSIGPSVNGTAEVTVSSISVCTIALWAEPSRVEPHNSSEITARVMEDDTPKANVSLDFETDFGYFTETRLTAYTATTNESGIVIAHFSAADNGTATITATDPLTGANATVVVSVRAGLPQIGDMDGDGNLTFDDVILLAKHYYFGDTICDNPDVTGDGSVTFDDVILLAKHYYFGDPIYL